MANPTCDICGSKMKKNGTTKAGTQRWRCPQCGASAVRKNNVDARHLKRFVTWLLGKQSQAELAICTRTFRAQTARFWELWPILPPVDEICHVIYMDGLWLSRRCVMLIAMSDTHVLGCHVARSESSYEWQCLMERICAPDVLVCDRAGGLEKARRALWPQIAVQRCTYHAFCQVKRLTAGRPQTQAEVELYALAKDLLSIKTQQEAALWLVEFHRWCERHKRFLKERTEDRRHFSHQRLRRARKGLLALCNAGTLFTYLDDRLTLEGPVPATNNKIENLNGSIRRMLACHRGMNIAHRIKAVMWFCYMHSEAPMGFGEMLKAFPTDAQVDQWRQEAARVQGSLTGEPALWGETILWEELHQSGYYPDFFD